MRGEIRIRKGGEVDGFEAGSFGTLYVGKVGAGEEGVAGVADVGFPGKIIISIGIANALGSIQGNVTARVPFPEDEIQGNIVAGIFSGGGFHILNFQHIYRTQLTHFPRMKFRSENISLMQSVTN